VAAEGEILMGRIILARHGQDEDNANHILNGTRDANLTLLGRQQAADLANKVLRELNVRWVISSPRRRAIQTADIVCEHLGYARVGHTIIDSLVERNHGLLEGRPYSDIPKLAEEWREAHGNFYVVRAEGGEDYPTLYVRASECLLEVKQTAADLKLSDNADVLVVSHGAIGKAMLMVHKGLPWERAFDTPSIGNCEFCILD
jgi:broad specificity phosphatase PhoE